MENKANATPKTKPLEIFCKISGEVFPYMTIYENTNNHKFEGIKNCFKVDIFDFKDALDDFGGLHFWDIQHRYNHILSSVESNMRWILMRGFSKEIEKTTCDNMYSLRVDITLRVDNTDKIIKKWFTGYKRYKGDFIIEQPNEELKFESKYTELKIMVINEIHNLMINDNEKAAALVDSLMENWTDGKE